MLLMAACGDVGGGSAGDRCRSEGRYADGVCDADCPHRDQDCDGQGDGGAGPGGGGGSTDGAAGGDGDGQAPHVRISGFSPNTPRLRPGERTAFYIGTEQAGTEQGVPDMAARLLSGPGRVWVEGGDVYYGAGAALGTAVVELTASVAEGASDTATTSVEVVNGAPVILGIGTDRQAVSGGDVGIWVDANDDGDGVLDYAFVLDGPGALSGPDAAMGKRFAAPDGFTGDVVLRVTVADAEGAEAASSFVITVEGNARPTITLRADAAQLVVGTWTGLSAEVDDPESDSLITAWALVSGPGPLLGSASHNRGLQPEQAGTSVVEFSVTEEALGRTTRARVEITVVDNTAPTGAGFLFMADARGTSEVDWLSLSGAGDTDDDALQAEVVEDGDDGVFEVAGTLLRYTPSGAFTDDTGSLRITDPHGGSVTVEVRVEVRYFTGLALRNLGGYGVKSDGTLWAWGSNAKGELGQGHSSVNVSVPVQVGASDQWDQVFAGGNLALALRRDGTLWGFGTNTYGAVGVGHTGEVLAPTQLGVDADWARVGIGRFHALGVKQDGSLWAWGRNERGQLCLGDTLDRSAPVRVGLGTGWARADGGGAYSVLLDAQGGVWACGRNDYGQFGDGSRTLIGGDGQVIGDDHDALVPTPAGNAVALRELAVGWDHVLALSGDGVLYAWGKNLSGQLGVGGGDWSYLTPQWVGGGYAAVAAGLDHSLALGDDGSLWSWGFNTHGQLGLGDRTTITEYPPGSGQYLTDDHDRDAPTQVGLDLDWLAVDAESATSGALKSTRRYAWGSHEGAYLGLGPGHPPDLLTPTPE